MAKHWIPSIDLVVTRHPALVEYLLEQGLVAAGVPTMAHVTAEDVAGRRVLGVLPYRIAVHALSVTEVPLDLSVDDRKRGSLPVERLREIAGEPITYQVGLVSPPGVLDVRTFSTRDCSAQVDFGRLSTVEAPTSGKPPAA